MQADRLVSPQQLKRMLGDGRELALLDVREEGVFSLRHLLFAVPLALSRLELRLDALVPRRSTRIVLYDAADGLAERAANRLAAFGYRDVAILEGGVEGWARAGYELFSGVNVPSKAFGEFVEHHEETPRLSAAEVKRLKDAGTDMVILDSRPVSEYRNMSIPGGIDCPGAELVYRVHDLAPWPSTLVVVNCAGRTRSIIGAQSLINAGIPNRVVALKDGTMGWHLAGLELEHGADRLAPVPSANGLATAKAAAARVGRRFGVKSIDADRLERFVGERDERSLYLLDVRSPEEFQAGHRSGSRSAPGGQLVQATDFYVGTRNARLVLIDDTGVRSTMTASWLIQMGWPEVYVLEGGLDGIALERGPAPRAVLGLDEAKANTLAAIQLQAMLERGEAVVLDLDTSLNYRERHIPGAWFVIRARLGTSITKLPQSGALVLTAADDALARLAAADLAGLTSRPVKVLAGGTAAWHAAGLKLESGQEHMADAADDVWYRPYDRAKGREQAMRDYLSWEVDLVQQIERDGDARFTQFPRI
ncbi:MAG: thiosulfate sulfurtransferase [Proteobacteria bacterium]|nr:thiosulfate sulfurtransferase [Pseudomonadota bacterium]MBI3499148.1 thiosulfate sulfurtransferase [Pseudomonadota bacterium]